MREYWVKRVRLTEYDGEEIEARLRWPYLTRRPWKLEEDRVLQMMNEEFAGRALFVKAELIKE